MTIQRFNKWRRQVARAMVENFFWLTRPGGMMHHQCSRCGRLVTPQRTAALLSKDYGRSSGATALARTPLLDSCGRDEAMTIKRIRSGVSLPTKEEDPRSIGVRARTKCCTEALGLNCRAGCADVKTYGATCMHTSVSVPQSLRRRAQGAAFVPPAS